MEWSADGLIIGTRAHGETSLIVEAMTKERGRHLGLVRGGRSRRHAAVLQLGNSVHLTWRARLDEHLGTFTVEGDVQRAAALMESRALLFGAQTLFAHLRLLPERDPHPDLLATTLTILDGDTAISTIATQLARFELRLLDELGFGLDLTSCAATGTTRNLTHVSPKSARAVSFEAAQPYRDRLLVLPAFLRNDAVPGAADLTAAFTLTGHFLAEHVWQARGIAPPLTRDSLVSLIAADL